VYNTVSNDATLAANVDKSAHAPTGYLRGEDRTIELGLRTLLSVAPSIPGADTLEQEIADTRSAEKRGCFLPDEDERVRTAFARYLSARAVLHSCIAELEPLVRQPESLTEKQHLEAFAVAFCAACLLSRSAEFIVGSYARAKVVHRKLDEPDARYGIPAKQFTKIYQSLSRPFNIWRFQQSIRFANDNEAKILDLAEDARMAPVIDLLLREKPQLIEFSRRTYFRKRLRYWFYSYTRGPRSGFQQAMFALFELSGRAVSNMRNPFHLKRVSEEVVAEVRGRMQPGDILITRHDDALSNYFLPGFWPHAALYIGTEAQRRELGVTLDSARVLKSADPVCVLEAKKDGVLFRPLESTLKVDSFTVVRPNMPKELIAEAIARACAHEGKYYDFHFDFRRSDRMVCTEVVYHAFHAVGGMQFTPLPGKGRFYISAEQILDYALGVGGYEVIAIFGVGGNSLLFGDEARQALIRSY
jgi:uncharacterized protein YycO